MSRPEKKRRKKKAPLSELDLFSVSLEPRPVRSGTELRRSQLVERLRAWCRDRDDGGWRKRPVLVLVNPNSGPGKARKVFANSLEPVLKEAGLSYRLVVTERRNHARDLIAKEE